MCHLKRSDHDDAASRADGSCPQRRAGPEVYGRESSESDARGFRGLLEVVLGEDWLGVPTFYPPNLRSASANNLPLKESTLLCRITECVTMLHRHRKGIIRRQEEIWRPSR